MGKNKNMGFPASSAQPNHSNCIDHIAKLGTNRKMKLKNKLGEMTKK